MATTKETGKVVFTADYDWLRIAEMHGLKVNWEADPLSWEEIQEAARMVIGSEWECNIDPEDDELGAAVLVEPRPQDTVLRPGDIVLTSGPGGDVAFIRMG